MCDGHGEVNCCAILLLRVCCVCVSVSDQLNVHVFGLREESSETTHECYYIISSSSLTAMIGPTHDASVRFRATRVSNPPPGHRSVEGTKSLSFETRAIGNKPRLVCDLAEQSGGKAEPRRSLWLSARDPPEGHPSSHLEHQGDTRLNLFLTRQTRIACSLPPPPSPTGKHGMDVFGYIWMYPCSSNLGKCCKTDSTY